MRNPTPKEIEEACLNYRHDYGILEQEEQEKIQFEAQEWLQAWLKVTEDSKTAE